MIQHLDFIKYNLKTRTFIKEECLIPNPVSARCHSFIALADLKPRRKNRASGIMMIPFSYQKLLLPLHSEARKVFIKNSKIG